MDRPEIDVLQFLHLGKWYGRAVEFDNLGDPGFWLADRLDIIEDALLGEESEIPIVARMLAEDYIRAAEEMCFPSPLDDVDDEDECLPMIEGDFRAFLVGWRRCIEAETKK